MPCSKMVENDTAAVGSTGKYVSEHAFGMIDTHLPNIALCPIFEAPFDFGKKKLD